MLSSKSHVGIHDDSPILSRISWAIFLGVIAAVLLYKGGLTALQTSVVIFGVPFSIIVVFAIKEFISPTPPYAKRGRTIIHFST